MDGNDAERSQRIVKEQIMSALAVKKVNGDKEEETVYSELQLSDENEK